MTTPPNPVTPDPVTPDPGRGGVLPPGVLPDGTDGPLRLRYLEEMAALLWPPPARPTLGLQADPIASQFIVVPDTTRPRLLVPAGSRRAAATAVRRYGEPGSAKQKLMLRALSATLATGIGGLALRDRFRVYGQAPMDTIETYLRSALGPDLLLSLHLGPARANRKPVLQLLSRSGGTVGFAKLGVNDLTRRLVRAERGTLQALDRVSLRHTTVPSVLHHGQWRDLEVLVQSPLPVWKPRTQTTSDRLAASMLEIAQACGVRAGTLRQSVYWESLGDRLAALRGDENVRVLQEAFAAIGERTAGSPLRYGAWHGDWTPWNMATLRDTTLVWDWERFAVEVPLGFDAIHYAFQEAVASGRREPRAAMTQTIQQAGYLLAPFQVPAPRLTALLYFIDIAIRYLQDGQAEAGARLGNLKQWLLPVLRAEVTERSPLD